MIRLLTTSAAIAVALTLGASPAAASMHYFQCRVYTGWSEDYGPLTWDDTGWQDSPAISVTGPRRNASGSSSLDLDGIHLGAGLDNVIDSPGSGLVRSALQWRDVVRLVSSVPPSTIKLTFGMHGTFSNYGDAVSGHMTSGIAQIPGWDLLPADGFPEAADFGGSVALATINPGGAPPEEPNNGYLVPGRDPLYSEANSVSAYWLLDILVPYDEEMGGYAFNLLASNRNEMFLGGRSSSISDFTRTFQLSSVTREDGSALDGPITFDSGYTLQAVPEPSGLVLAGVGACALGALRVGKSIGGRWRRRRSRHRLPSRDEASALVSADPPRGQAPPR